MPSKKLWEGGEMLEAPQGEAMWEGWKLQNWNSGSGTSHTGVCPSAGDFAILHLGFCISQLGSVIELTFWGYWPDKVSECMSVSFRAHGRCSVNNSHCDWPFFFPSHLLNGYSTCFPIFWVFLQISNKITIYSALKNEDLSRCVLSSIIWVKTSVNCPPILAYYSRF